MENFNQFENEPRPVKEKSIYSLNLDGARIAILSFIVIGVIAVALLIGMNISGSSEDPALPTQPLAGLDNPLNENDQMLPPVTDGSSAQAQQSVQDPLFDSTQQSIAENTAPPVSQTVAHNDTEIKHVKPKSSTKQVKVATNQKSHKASANTALKPAFAKAGEKVYYSSKASTSKKGSFAIQVASFDTITKAKTEVSALKSMNYDSYIDKTEVNGMTYFRVRIGPLSSKTEAADLLEKITLEPRYAESYIVKEI